MRRTAVSVADVSGCSSRAALVAFAIWFTLREIAPGGGVARTASRSSHAARSSSRAASIASALSTRSRGDRYALCEGEAQQRALLLRARCDDMTGHATAAPATFPRLLRSDGRGVGVSSDMLTSLRPSAATRPRGPPPFQTVSRSLKTTAGSGPASLRRSCCKREEPRADGAASIGCLHG